jgi:hypothetical protein
VQYLGKQVVCQHCGARFEAYDASSGGYPPPGSSLNILARAEELLQTAAATGLTSSGAETLGLSSDVVPLPVRPK